MPKDIIVGVPCSRMHIYYFDVPSTREDEALAFGAGYAIGGGRARVLIQNSGLGNCVDVITSLLKTYGIKDVYIDVSDKKKPRHHREMHKITKKLIRILNYDTIQCY